MKTALVEKIKSLIRQEGRITFERFMAMALYEPGLGYYASAEVQIGKAGDFYTSPHLHPAFGWTLGKQVEEFWEILGGGGLTVIEQGPGKGFLAKDILDYLKAREAYGYVSYYLAEMNPALVLAQERLLEEHRERVFWTSSLEEFHGVKGVIVSNELLDAFPVHVIELDGELNEIYVTLEKDEFKEVKGPPSTPLLAEYLEEFMPPEEKGNYPPGYRTEANLALRQWLKGASRALSEGFVLTIDYGWPSWEYLNPERDRGTLLAYYRHQVLEDFFGHVGEEDMTAHVNFSALKKWGEEEGLRCLGFAPQGTYLVSAGIDHFMENLPQEEILKIKGLILPGTMGETHKVMVQYKGEKSPALPGFALRNQAGIL